VLLADTYTVIVTNQGNGCTGTASINITSDFAIPIPTIQTANNQFELNCSNPTLLVEAGGGKLYTWSGNLPSDSIVSISAPGIYTVTVTGVNGCTSTTNVIITSNFSQPPAFIISLDNNYVLSCKNPEITLLAQQGVSYSWQPNVSNNYIAYVNQPGNYVVTVTGANGCTATAQVTILDNTGTVELFWIDTIRPTCYANDGKLTVGVTQGTSPYTYSWNTNPNNINSLSNIPPGYYYVIVTDAAGCKDTLQIDFTCKLDNNGNDTTKTAITIINLITPNDDGTNDTWVIPEIDQYPNNKVSILNRWGDEIFKAQPYQNNWSGQSNTGMVVGGNKVTSGVYFYIIDLGNGTLPIKGYLVLEY
jgi:gliding motility-associated-like protein